MVKKYVGEKIIGGINEAVRYLREGADAAKKYYQGSAVPKHEASVLNRLSPSDRKKELAKQILHRKAIDKGRRDFDAKGRLTVMDAGVDSGGLGGAGISARSGISERMMDNAFNLKKSASDILWGSSGGKSLNKKKMIEKGLSQKFIGTRGRDVRTERISDKRNITYSEGKNPIKLEKSSYQREREREKLGKILDARRAGQLYAKTLKRELKHFFPNLSEKIQRQYVAKKMKGIGESIKDKRKEIGIE